LEDVLNPNTPAPLPIVGVGAAIGWIVVGDIINLGRRTSVLVNRDANGDVIQVGIFFTVEVWVVEFLIFEVVVNGHVFCVIAEIIVQLEIVAIFLVHLVNIITLTHPETRGSIEILVDPIIWLEVNAQTLHVISDLGIEAPRHLPPFIVGFGKVTQVIFYSCGVEFLECSFSLPPTGKFGLDAKAPTVIETM
jgi:hypothetical protein